mmetsp:Transcript_1340/g.3088  ORF Transcript_1340/g.3088 Transcript_1340/m.3088 type:complete len:298 (-) Transcript_1340:59-952(-)|eukprot:CAMPEP_0116096432 /NCGR_PEP_ID=MMETSP0327-20121206/10177_1 /TAXON_ID=44447 /ORGANISM="Pseudo-nitzschia delicatissima, Strain B596" /LENGTH=297 /DNA_ID=CAMNT_0003588133 /DNA_START=44 /DNA_END=937 /DNA_ORIENTATION=-
MARMKNKITLAAATLLYLQQVSITEGLSTKQPVPSRRQALGSILGGGAAAILLPSLSNAMETDVDSFLRSGGVAMPMGVSGQAGKAKPVTGVLLREGTDISRDSKSGNVLAEILVQKKGSSDAEDFMAVVTSFQSPWPLATGAVYDVECRDTKTGDGAFLAVSPPIADGSLADVKDQFFIKSLFGPRGRFSFYGQPTDIKVKKSVIGDDASYKILDVSFSTLSQATQTEVPRRSKIVVTLPKGSKQAVMLVGSASASRWIKGADKAIADSVGSFRATAAPETNLKLRAVSNDRDLEL